MTRRRAAHVIGSKLGDFKATTMRQPSRYVVVGLSEFPKSGATNVQAQASLRLPVPLAKGLSSRGISSGRRVGDPRETDPRRLDPVDGESLDAATTVASPCTLVFKVTQPALSLSPVVGR